MIRNLTMSTAPQFAAVVTALDPSIKEADHRAILCALVHLSTLTGETRKAILADAATALEKVDADAKEAKGKKGKGDE